jgi:hypothetical protein
MCDLPGAAREVTLWGQGAARNAATTRLRLEVFLRGRAPVRTVPGAARRRGPTSPAPARPRGAGVGGGRGAPPDWARDTHSTDKVLLLAPFAPLGKRARGERRRPGTTRKRPLLPPRTAAAALGRRQHRPGRGVGPGPRLRPRRGRPRHRPATRRGPRLPGGGHGRRLVAGRPGRFRFAHALVREALYGELPSRERRRLHDRAGAALVELRGDDFEGYLAELAITSPRRPVRARPTRPSPSPGRPATGR